MNKISGIHFWQQEMEVWITRYDHEQQRWPTQKYKPVSPASRRGLKDVLHLYSIQGMTDGVILDIGDGEGWSVFMSIAYYGKEQSGA